MVIKQVVDEVADLVLLTKAAKDINEEFKITEKVADFSVPTDVAEAIDTAAKIATIYKSATGGTHTTEHKAILAKIGKVQARIRTLERRREQRRRGARPGPLVREPVRELKRRLKVKCNKLKRDIPRLVTELNRAEEHIVEIDPERKRADMYHFHQILRRRC